MISQRGLVLSDLHLFAGRSDGHALFDSVRSEIGEVDVLVLNGDTFDFRWSHFSDERKSIDEALLWLNELIVSLRSDQRVHFLHGNHDCLDAFSDELNELEKFEEKLIVDERMLTLGENLFLHGDGANWNMDRVALDRFREKWSRDQPRGKVAARSYEAVDALGISKAFHRIYFPAGKTIQRIAFHLDDVKPDWRSETESVYFGHTHCPFENIGHEGVRFFNTGSAIRGMGFAPQRFEFSVE